ncbi:SCO2525 family SAM-dependent methyltransferase [Actinoplanes sp. N902-109]|uniref:SCO2525 family SAM-dependent methyltransferase n=1 Tax=Actinoplanes sp. (strain N902-109) TaxID=649831 RepID=UPI0003295E47|nr:SCO2525 family SAM-dependent methyltransferase [Actinoplanes sp. N902-109]AGL18314.1 putative N-methyltransferase [Actinoplanes sp. N902-109]
MGDLTQAAQTDQSAVWARIGNGDVDWDHFDSEAYFAGNYEHLRADDREIIHQVIEFFESTTFRGGIHGRGIDVGAGTNLYPALTMLPHTAEITLWERAASNIDWLRAQIVHPLESWWQFWQPMATSHHAYGRIKEPLNLLSRRARVSKANLFLLPTDSYDIGTMFFVAESITNRTDEFERAVAKFVGCLRRRAPFAATFMRNSSGYTVGNTSFPACSVDETDVARALQKVARDVTIRSVRSFDLREGYGGMIVATGRKKM